ncbi:MAG: Tol-Pal system beta propeller repeat protein TolB [Alphaproteobacteria bacterium]
MLICFFILFYNYSGLLLRRKEPGLPRLLAQPRNDEWRTRTRSVIASEAWQSRNLSSSRYLSMTWVVILFLSFIQPSHALKIEITQGQVDPTPIAVTDLLSADGTTLGADIATVVGNDLASSGLFRLIDKKAFIQDTISLQKEPRFTDWRLVNAQLLFVGQIVSEGSNVRIDFRLFDAFSGTQMLGLSFTGDPKKWRKLAHMIADAIYKRVTGESGYFDTQIAFIDESGRKGKGRVRRLAIMDLDGHNPRYLTNGKHLVVTPRFSSSTMEIAYLSYANKFPSVYIYNIATGENKLLRRFEGMTFAPRFSMDGDSIVMSLEKEGYSAIYTMNIRNNQMQALTKHTSIDTSPCYSPDGQSIVFISDRGDGDADTDNRSSRNVNIFVMDANGGNVRRISFGSGKYFQPVWSPRGDWIAFTRFEKGSFYIGVMRPDGSDERTIINGYLVESPVWAANGRELIFTMEKGPGARPYLYRVNLTGHNLQKVNTPHDASDGAWSRLLSEISVQ